MIATMNDRPIPLRADPAALRASDRRSFVRAVVALALSANPASNRRPSDVLKTWGDDALAGHFLKSAQSPTGSGDVPQTTATKLLPLLAPASASARLLAAATAVDMSGIATVSLPFIGKSGRPVAPFVAEGAPAPAVDLRVSATTLGPARKLLIISSLSRELQDASAGTAEKIISDALATSAEQSLDAALLGNAPASDIAPPGILNGVTAMPSAGTKGAQGIADDLGLLAEAISKAGINADDMIVVTTAKLATKLRVLASLKFENGVLSSAALADGVVIGLIGRGLATGYASGGVSIEASNEPLVHFEDAAPADIVNASGTPAFPVRSAFQTESLVIRVRGWCAWAVQPGAVAKVTGADW
jgi:hypothetical protein